MCGCPKQGESQQETFILCHKLGVVGWWWGGFLVTYLIERYFSMLKVYSAFGIQLFYLNIRGLIILNDTSGCCKKPSQTVLCTGHVMMMNHISRDFSPSFSLPWMWLCRGNLNEWSFFPFRHFKLCITIKAKSKDTWVFIAHCSVLRNSHFKDR